MVPAKKLHADISGVENSTPELRVDLLVCGEPGCEQVGKMPVASQTSMKGWCTGPMRARHKKRRMQVRTFVEERSPS